MEAKDIVKKIEEKGFEAYIVGGYVRDYLLGVNSHDIDICTNAKVKDILEIFGNVNAFSNEYGSVKLISDHFNIDITTYRRDLKYNGTRKAVEIQYVDNLIDDINRRDFVMNTVCMNSDGTIIDLLGGKKDIENRVIRAVGDTKERLLEDPLRMLRAVRFATRLDFQIEADLYRELKKQAPLLEQLSLERVKEELTKILSSQNALRGLDILRDLGFLPFLGIEYKEVVQVSDICGMYSQLKMTKEYPFTKEEKEMIKNIQSILNYGKIDKNILFSYDLYVCIVAGSILGMLPEDISTIYKSLEIKSIKDIKIDSLEICAILQIEPSKIIRDVYEDLKNNILDHTLENTNEAIVSYIKQNREKWLNEGTYEGVFKE